MADREMRWPGCYNARDLGGLETADGRRRTRWGALVRSDCPAGFEMSGGRQHAGLTSPGWTALASHGIRTIINLREDPIVDYGASMPRGIATAHVPLDDSADRRFWEHCRVNGLDESPLYYETFLLQKPERCLAVLSEIANAQAGGVLIHCRLGRDRTGLIGILLLAFAGVPRDVIVADYLEGIKQLEPLFEAIGDTSYHDTLMERVRRKGTTPAQVVEGLLDRLDVHAYLRGAGFADQDAAKLRSRLTESPPVAGLASSDQ